MRVQVQERFFYGWGLWYEFTIEQVFDYYYDRPVMVGSQEEADFLEGYGLILGTQFEDMSVIHPTVDYGVYISASTYEIKTHIRVLDL